MNPSAIVIPPLSALYGAIIRTRLAAYSRGFLSSSRLGVPVISVGNLTVGGTGKTPLVEKICRLLAQEGRNVCVLTRGYKREHSSKRVLVSDGTAIHATEQESGDEAFLLARNLLGQAAVVSDANRAEAGRWAIKELDCDAFVLDDGFQHLQLERDLNVLVVDATDPWGGKALLPSGRLREPLSGINRADWVMITRADESTSLEALETEIRQLAGDLPIFRSQMQALKLTSLAGNSVGEFAAPRSVGAFCGVGNPDSFFRLLRRQGRVLVSSRAFADHHRYTQEDLDLVVEGARRNGAQGLITTAKDAVKLQSMQFALPCFVQDIEIVIEEEDRLLTLLRQTFAKT